MPARQPSRPIQPSEQPTGPSQVQRSAPLNFPSRVNGQSTPNRQYPAREAPKPKQEQPPFDRTDREKEAKPAIQTPVAPATQVDNRLMILGITAVCLLLGLIPLWYFVAAAWGGI